MEETLLKRMMPNSKEAEGAVIGSMIMDRDSIVKASEMLTKDDFYYSQYGILFETMVELSEICMRQNRFRPIPSITQRLCLKKQCYGV